MNCMHCTHCTHCTGTHCTHCMDMHCTHCTDKKIGTDYRVGFQKKLDDTNFVRER